MIIICQFCLCLLSGSNVHDHAQIYRLTIVIINPGTVDIRPADFSAFGHDAILHGKGTSVFNSLSYHHAHHIHILRIHQLRRIIVKLHTILRPAVTRQTEKSVIGIHDLEII